MCYVYDISCATLYVNAAVWYYKICRNSQPIPKYVNIKIKLTLYELVGLKRSDWLQECTDLKA